MATIDKFWVVLNLLISLWGLFQDTSADNNLKNKNKSLPPFRNHLVWRWSGAVCSAAGWNDHRMSFFLFYMFAFTLIKQFSDRYGCLGGFKHIVTVAETTPITVNVITDNGFLWHLLLPPLLRLHRHKIPRPASPGMDWDGMCTIERYTMVTFFDRGALGRRVMARVKGHEPDWTCDIDAVSYVGCRFPLKGEMSVMFFTVLRTMRHVGHQTIDTCDRVKSFLMHFFLLRKMNLTCFLTKSIKQ